MIPRIDGYELQTVIGSGGHAVVWAARDRRTGERVAVKWLPSSTMRDESGARAEAALLASLDHPHLIQLKSYVVGADGCALVMEYAAGGSLAALLRRRARLTPPEVVAALSPVASALSYAHGEGVMHRDVSAANILFAADGHPKLADLGLARLTTIRSNPTDIVGTPAYLDPVVASGAAPVVAGDVFALGAIALHALTGLGPWQRTPTDPVDVVLGRAASADIVDLDLALAEVPPELAAPVRRALEIQPYRRGTAAEFALDLRAGMAPRSVVVRAGRVGQIGWPRGGNHDDEPDRVAIDLTRLVRRPSDIAGSSGAESTPRGRRLRDRLRSARARQSAPAYRARHRFSRPASVSGSALSAGPDRQQCEPAPRALPARRVRRGVLVGCAAATLGAGVGASGLTLARTSASAGVQQPRGFGARPAAAADSASASTANRADRPLEARDAVATATALAQLRRLDARRADAYAAGEPALLASVYGARDLLALDQARLRSAVPAGCAVIGLSTAYTGLQVLSVSADELELAVTAVVEDAELACPKRPPARLAPGQPARLRITLRRVADAYRIVEERPLAGP